MTMPSRFLALAGALALGVTAVVVGWPASPAADPTRNDATATSGERATPTAATPSDGPGAATATGAADAPPLPPAIAAAAAENCDTPAKVEAEAAPIAKFLEAPCGPGEAEKPPSDSSATRRP